MNPEKKNTDSKAQELFDTLFTSKQRSKPVVHGLLGNIDSIENRRLNGWIVDKSDLDRAVAFEVYVGSTKVGEGVAESYRADLEAIGYGAGRHGFGVDVSSAIYGANGDTFQLRDAATGTPISHNSFTIEVQANTIAEIIGINGRLITAQLQTADSIGSVPSGVEVLVDGKERLPCAIKNAAGGKIMCDAQIPATYFDGLPHAYEVISADTQLSSTAYVEILQPNNTPEEHLTDSLTEVGYTGLPKNASYRYESLNAHLSRFMQDGTVSGIELATLCQAHEEVLRGFHGRKTYSKLKLPDVKYPDVSIIIPARNNFPITYHCIASLILSFNKVSYEVILVDDQSDDETTAAEEIIENIRIVRNENNLGFVKSNNKAVEHANGTYVCLLNNDTEVTTGWLDEALSLFDMFNDVGAVGSKLIYADGSLQEAGGIVWGSGAPWNYGKNANASHPKYNYTRQADYLSGAALFVKRDIWEEVGGFSEEFAPAYYEDTDIAFKIRKAGYRTLYCPTSTVVHFEGKSNGTSTSSGIKKYQEINSSTFKEKWFTEYKTHGHEGQTPHIEVDRENNFRVLVIDADTPRKNRDAGSYAAFQEMKLMMELGCKLTFVPSNFAHMGIHTEYLQKMGVECLHYPFYHTIEQLLKLRGLEFDAVYITRYEIAANNIEMIRKYSDAKIIFNNADLHFMRELRQELQKDESEFDGPLATRDKELEVIDQCDVAICYTDAERAVITSHLMKESNILRCPWVVQPVEQVPAFHERHGIAFLGGYAHSPNVEAVTFFCTQVMPQLIERIPDIEFRIYGSRVPDEILALQSDYVNVVGFIDEVSDVYNQARVFVSPLLSGAGLKGKVIDCMAHGLPSVMTSVSAEGTGLVHSQSTFVAESVSEWCDSIQELYENQETWQRLSDNSLQVANSLFSPAEGLRNMRKILSKVEVYSDEQGEERFKGYLR